MTSPTLNGLMPMSMSLISTRLAHRLSGPALKRVFAGFLYLVGLSLLLR